MPKMKVIRGTLCFIVRPGSEVLLAKKVDDIGKGKLNGFGGKQEKGESLEDCCVREVEQECGLKIDRRSLLKVAIVNFHNIGENGKPFIFEAHVYFARNWKGLPQSTNEMVNPKWYQMWRWPFHKMMLADPFWLNPIIRYGQKIIANVWYGPDQKTLLRPVRIREVESFPD